MNVRRPPAVAGMFYSNDEKGLRREIESAFLGEYGPGNLPVASQSRQSRVIGLVSPHAGYAYSGYAAAHAYNALADDGIPETAVLLGPNHTGMGMPVAIMEEGIWTTPLGAVSIDGEVAAFIIRACPYAGADVAAHDREHSLEVQVPFLQYLGGAATRIVPITIGIGPGAEAKVLARDLGKAVASALEGRDAVVIASTDFTHYESRAAAQRKDAAAIAAIESLDSDGLIDVVRSLPVSMCGVTPTAVVLEACRALGAEKAELLKYYTSGDITGDTDRVVGYAALRIMRG